MSAISWIIVLFVTLILQTTLLPLIFTKGIRPDLLLAVVVSAGLLTGKEYGLGLGFVAGLLQDLSSGNIFGINLLAKMATGYIAGLAERKVFKENILLPLIAVMLASAVNGSISLLMLIILGYKIDVLPALMFNIIPALGYNMLVAIPVHRIVFRLNGN